MDSKPKKLKQNVALKFRNLKVTITEKKRFFRLIECNSIIASPVLNVLSYILFLKVDLSIFRFLTARDLACSGAATARTSETQFNVHLRNLALVECHFH